jgi:cell division protein ZapA (FtsZ GTPase activity inhibitor)
MIQGRERLAALIVAAVCMGCAAGAAQASATTVVAAVKTQDRIVKSSAAYRGLKHVTADTPQQARKLIVEFKALQRRLEHAATVVSRATATDARQRRGKADWVTGVRDLGRGIGQLDSGLTDVIKGRTAAGKALLKRANRTLAAANAIGTRGKRLLGIPAGE